MKPNGRNWFLPFVGVLLLLAAPSFVSIPLGSFVNEATSFEQECNITAASTLQSEPSIKLVRESSSSSFTAFSFSAIVQSAVSFKFAAFFHRKHTFQSSALRNVESSLYLNNCNLRL
jgi:hypothetical protein